MKIANRQYYCPTCGHKELHSTNHTGEIYCNCKACGNSPLYCAEVDEHATIPFIEAKLTFYKFNLENQADEKEYKKLCETLKEGGYKKFDYLELSPAGHKHLFSLSAFEQYDGQVIKLYNDMGNQFVSNIGRVFQWKEAIFPNRKIKHGYYISRF